MKTNANTIGRVLLYVCASAAVVWAAVAAYRGITDPIYASGYNQGVEDGYNTGASEGARCAIEWVTEMVENEYGIDLPSRYKDAALEDAIAKRSYYTYPFADYEYEKYGRFLG